MSGPRITWSKTPVIPAPASGPAIGYLGTVEIAGEGDHVFTIEPCFRHTRRGPGDAAGMVRDGFVLVTGELATDGRAGRSRRFDTLREAKSYCERSVREREASPLPAGADS